MNETRPTEKFKSWVAERVGHPLGVLLGVAAVAELEQENKQLIETSHTANKELRGEVERLEKQVVELKEQLVDAVGAMNASKSVVMEIDLKYGVKTMIGKDSMSVMLDESINEASQLLNKLGAHRDK